MEVYLGRYLVLRDGTMFSITKDGLRPKKPFITHRGYARQELAGQKREYVHRIVAGLFLPRARGKNQVDHINGDKMDNRAENLRWCTNHENTAFYLSSERKVADTYQLKSVIGTRVIDKEETVFASMFKAAQITGARAAGIRRCIRGETKTSGGYYWRLHT